MLNQPAIAPLGQALPNAEIFRRLAARMGFTEPVLSSDSDETLASPGLPPEPGVDMAAAARAGLGNAADARCAVCRRRLPTPDGKVQVDAPGLGVPDYVPNHECAGQTAPGWPRATRWR